MISAVVSYQVREEQEIRQTLKTREKLCGHLVKGFSGSRLHDEQDAISVWKPSTRLTEVPLRVYGIFGSGLIQCIVVNSVVEILGHLVVEVLIVLIVGCFGILTAEVVERCEYQDNN